MKLTIASSPGASAAIRAASAAGSASGAMRMKCGTPAPIAAVTAAATAGWLCPSGTEP